MKTARSAAIALWLILAACLIIQAGLWFSDYSDYDAQPLDEAPYLLGMNFSVISSLAWRDAYMGVWTLTLSAAYIVTAIALCLKSRKITLLSLCVPSVLFLSLLSDTQRLYRFNITNDVVVAALRIAAVAAIYFAIKRGGCKTNVISAVSGTIALLCGAYPIFSYMNWNIPLSEYYGLYVFTLLYYLVLSAAYFFTGIACQAMPKAKRERRTTPRAPAARIDKLKELLDTGVITQEEFDTKKEEILKSDH